MTTQNKIRKSRVTTKKNKVLLNSLPLVKRPVRKVGGKRRRKTRTLETPKIGGFLPLIPLFAGLSALGSIAGGASAIANAVNNSKNAQKQLAEEIRHNKLIEAAAMGKKGSGLTSRRKKGRGLFLRPYQKKLANMKKK